MIGACETSVMIRLETTLSAAIKRLCTWNAKMMTSPPKGAKGSNGKELRNSSQHQMAKQGTCIASAASTNLSA
jgi:hypothetical protein